MNIYRFLLGVNFAVFDCFMFSFAICPINVTMVCPCALDATTIARASFIIRKINHCSSFVTVCVCVFITNFEFGDIGEQDNFTTVLLIQ